MDRAALDAEIAAFLSSESDDDSAAGLGTRTVVGAKLEPALVAVSDGGSAPRVGPLTLVEQCCRVLAKNLHQLRTLDQMPEELAATVADMVETDRKMLHDDGLAVWLGAVVGMQFATCKPANVDRTKKVEHELCLRWAENITDRGLRHLATTILENTEWSQDLAALDLSFCDQIGDTGVEGICQALARGQTKLQELCLASCKKLTDQSLAAIGRSLPYLVNLDLCMLPSITDFGLQHVVRGCTRIEELALGHCVGLTNISVQLVADHLGKATGKLRALDLGGLVNITDVDIKDVIRCSSLTALSLRACDRLSDAGLSELVYLFQRQARQHAKDRENAVPSGQDGAGDATQRTGSEAMLRWLDLGGLNRLSDKGLKRLMDSGRSVTSLDLRGCARLTPNGLVAALSPTVNATVPVPRLELRELVITACPACTDVVCKQLETLHPGIVVKL